MQFGYADDLALLHNSSTPEANVVALQQDLENILTWGDTMGISFDPGKSELMHFTRRPRVSNPDLHSQIHPCWSIPATPLNKPMRWLGVWYDRCLSFQPHVRIVKARGLQTAAHLKALSSTVRGLSPLVARAAAVACIPSSIFYAAESWWQVCTAHCDCERSTRPQSLSSNEHQLNIVLSAMCRAILPVYKTTPTAALFREAGIPPAKAWLNEASGRMALRTQRLDIWHPLVTRATNLESWRSNKSRLARAFALLETPIERITPLRSPPWTHQPSNTELHRRVGYSATMKTAEGYRYQEWLHSIPPSAVLAFSDGSQAANQHTGSGWVLYHHSNILQQGVLPLGTAMEVFDAEATAAYCALKNASKYAHLGPVYLCLDNLAVATRIVAPETCCSSQQIFDKIHALLANFPSLHGVPTVRWVPGHSQSHGNDKADLLAKEGTTSLATFRYISYARARRALCIQKWALADAHFTHHQSARYRLLNLNARNVPKELQLSRYTLGKLLACRSGHGDFEAYHIRFTHHDANMRCQCGLPKTPDHFSSCLAVPRRFRFSNTHTSLALLSTFNGSLRFEAWVQKTNYFNQYWSQH